jgi:hypothetical protein
MRRRLGIVLLLAAMAAGVVLWSRLSPRQGVSQSESPEHTDTSSVVPPLPATTASVPAVVDSNPSPPPVVPPPSAPNRGVQATGTGSEEQFLVEQVRALVRADPVRAEALARESRQRFPQGETADERDALLVDALVNQQRIGAARDESYYYFQHHPGGQFGEHLFIMTGARPAPQGPGR